MTTREILQAIEHAHAEVAADEAAGLSDPAPSPTLRTWLWREAEFDAVQFRASEGGPFDDEMVDELVERIVDAELFRVHASVAGAVADGLGA